jgi:hypothetical protein
MRVDPFDSLMAMRRRIGEQRKHIFLRLDDMVHVC